MASDPFLDDMLPSRLSKYEIGQDLASLSLFELEERISDLKQEISRLEQAIEQKKKTQIAADAFFKS